MKSYLPAKSPKVFTVDIQGSDHGDAGIGSYDVYVSREGGAYTRWISGTTSNSAVITGEPGITYRMFSVARDNVGNVEEFPSQPDAITRTEFYITRLAVQSSNNVDNVGVSWESATDKYYNVIGSTNLLTSFCSIATNLPATPPENVYTDRVESSKTRFYRVEIGR